MADETMSEQLLGAISLRLRILRESEARFADQLAPGFNVIEMVRDDEFAISSGLAKLLDPTGNHGQGRLFLDGLLDLLNLPEGFDTTHVKKVGQEHSTAKGRRLDVLLEFEGGILGIENKPWAADGIDQLSDYADYLKNESRGRPWILVYLADSDPSEFSIESSEVNRHQENDNFQSLSFSSLAKGLETCAKSTRALHVRIFAEDLASFLRRTVSGDLDMTEQNEIFDEVCATDERLSSAVSLISSWRFIKDRLIRQFDSQLRSCFEAYTGLTYSDQIVGGRALTSGDSRCGFQLTSAKWPMGVALRFQFDHKGYTEFFISVANRPNEEELSPEDQRIVSAALRDEFGSISRSNTEWAWYVYASETDEFGEGFTQWDVSHQPWIAIKNDSLASKVLELTKRADRELSRLEREG